MTKKQQYRLQVVLLAIALFLVSLVLPACTSQVRYVSEPLAQPEAPTLPAITADELQCVSDETYKKLATRDLLRKQYAEELAAIIAATHEQKARLPPE